MAAEIDYASPGPLTGRDGGDPAVLAMEADELAGVCFPVHGLVIQPTDAEALDLSGERFAENQIRPAARIIEALLSLDPAPLNVAREPARRVVGTCSTPS